VEVEVDAIGIEIGILSKVERDGDGKERGSKETDGRAMYDFS
jgi:hypothetical protein